MSLRLGYVCLAFVCSAIALPATVNAQSAILAIGETEYEEESYDVARGYTFRSKGSKEVDLEYYSDEAGYFRGIYTSETGSSTHEMQVDLTFQAGSAQLFWSWPYYLNIYLICSQTLG